MRFVSATILMLGILTLGAGPATLSVTDQLRSANAALEHGDLDTAARLFEEVAGRAQDPGLVAFNRGVLHAAKGEFREAELDYRRVLDDAEAPPERRARAWYNRGTALLLRGGSADVYHSASACFEHFLASPNVDAGLRADARHNLELARIRWAEERKNSATATKASRSAPEDSERAPAKSGKAKEPDAKSAPEVGNGTNPARGPGERATPTKLPPGASPRETPQTLPGAGNLPVIDSDHPQTLGTEDMRELLRRTRERLDRERRSLQQALHGPARAGIRVW